MSKLLTVFGATGAQGGSVVKVVLGHPKLSQQFRIRAITRDPSSSKAKALAEQGVEPVKADLNDESSLQEAIKGSYAVYAVTNYWEKASKSIEIAQGKAIADACKAVGVHHLIWSALPNVTKITEGKLSHVEHFDGKAEIAEYIESIKGDDMIASYFMPAFYMSNLTPKEQNGVLTLAYPWDAEKTHVPLLDTAGDSGKFVAGILDSDAQIVNGRYVHAVSEWLTPKEIATTYTKVAGREVKFQPVPVEVFQGFLPPPVAQELTENMVLVRDYSYYGIGAENEQGKHNEVLGGLKTTTFAKFLEHKGQ